MRDFLTIMRDVYKMRKKGVSIQVVLLTLDDDDLQVIWERMVQAAELDARIEKYLPEKVRHG